MPVEAAESATHRDEVVRHPWHFRLLVFLVSGLAATIILLWFKTLRLTVINGEKERQWRKEGPMVYAIWHQGVLFAPYFWRWRKGWLLASASRDGEWVAGIIHRLGNVTIRGSSSRGGRIAIQQMVEHLKAGISGGIIPDAPKGPAFTCKPGILVVAQRAGVPVIPTQFGFERAKRLRSWDRTLIPMPFSRAVVKFGEPFRVDPSLEGESFDRRLAEFAEIMKRDAAEIEAYFGPRAADPR